MSEQENLQTVQAIFAAFGRGDLPAMLNLLTEDVRWIVSGPKEVPHFGEFQGHAGVTDFIVSLTSGVEFERFEPQEFIAKEDKVVVTGGERGRVRATGRSFDNDWAMVFTVRDGKVARFRSYEDSGAVADAFRA